MKCLYFGCILFAISCILSEDKIPEDENNDLSEDNFSQGCSAEVNKYFSCFTKFNLFDSGMSENGENGENDENGESQNMLLLIQRNPFRIIVP